MASTTTIFSVMLLLSLFMSSTFVSAARQLNETPKVTGHQTANSRNSKVETESTQATDKTGLGDKKFLFPMPLTIPIPIPIPIPRGPSVPASVPVVPASVPASVPVVPASVPVASGLPSLTPLVVPGN